MRSANTARHSAWLYRSSSLLIKAIIASLAAGCANTTVVEQRRQSIADNIEAIHRLNLAAQSNDQELFDPVRPVVCVCDAVQSLASPLFTTSPEQAAALLATGAAQLRVCQGCAVKAAGVAVWQPHLPPATQRHERPLFVIENQIVFDTGLGRDERYRTTAPPTGRWASSTAVPITADGYFITAAHCVDDVEDPPSSTNPAVVPSSPLAMPLTKNTTSFHVACLTQDNQPALTPARIVWTSFRNRGPRVPSEAYTQPDLAILWADVRPAVTARLAPPESVTPGTLIIGGRALGMTDYSGHTFPHCAGRIAEISTVEFQGLQFQLLKTDAPAAPGDSGGPMLTTAGKLAGITVGAGKLWNGEQVSHGWMLPEAELTAIIQTDRAAQAGARPAPAQPDASK